MNKAMGQMITEMVNELSISFFSIISVILFLFAINQNVQWVFNVVSIKHVIGIILIIIAVNVADGLQPNNIIPIDQQGVNDRADGVKIQLMISNSYLHFYIGAWIPKIFFLYFNIIVLNQPANMQQQENAGNQGAQLPQNIVQANNLRGGNGVQDANAWNQAARLPPGIAANDQGNNVPGGNIVQVGNAQNQAARLPPGLAANDQSNNVPGGNQVQVEDPGLRQGHRPVQGQHGQLPGAGSVLEKSNFY